jgi:hypothetical protein
MSNVYKVVWEIEIHADSPKEAAEKARRVQLDTTHYDYAQVFDVYTEDGKHFEFDLHNKTETKLS